MTPTGWTALIGQFSRTFPAEARAPIRLHDANTFPFTLWPLPAEGLLDPRRPTFHLRLPNAHIRQLAPAQCSHPTTHTIASPHRTIVGP